jgi:glycosyltransferase involved in cell wall biosynthesis
MISVVVPVLDEVESLPQLYRELAAVTGQEGFELQIVMVDDGSHDESWSVIEQLAASDSRVLGIHFRRNFGKTAALSAGFDAASGERIVTMDADLQDDPAEIPRLLAKLDEGYDLVNGWKRRRYDPWRKVWASRGFNWLVSAATGVRLHDHNCGLKCMRRELVHELRLFSDLHRFIPVLATARGFRVTEIAVHHRPRAYGASKYVFARIFKALLDLMLVKFVLTPRVRPEHLLGGAGLLSLGAGMLGSLVTALSAATLKFWGRMPIPAAIESTMFSGSLYLVGGGLVLLMFALVGGIIAARLTRQSDTYSIAKHTAPYPAAPRISSGRASESP